jgi:hypothetical protein
VKAEVSTAAWLFDYPDGSNKLKVEVKENGDIWICGVGDGFIRIEGANVREAYWLSDALTQAGELSKKRPLS